MRGREKIDGIRSVKRDKVEALGQSQGRKGNVNLYNIMIRYKCSMYDVDIPWYMVCMSLRVDHSGVGFPPYP